MVNLIKQNIGSEITWKDSGGTYGMTLDDLANSAGRVGAVGDLGEWPHAIGWRWFLTSGFAATPTAGLSLDAYLSVWNDDAGSAQSWGSVGATDSALGALTQRFNLWYIGSLIVETAATTQRYTGGWIPIIPGRYVSPVLVNVSGAALADVGTVAAIFSLKPILPEIQ